MSDLTTSTETTLTTSSFGDVIVERDVVKVRRYRWPELLLSIILFTLFVCGTVVLGSFSYFTYIQQKLSVPIPWFVVLALPPPHPYTIDVDDCFVNGSRYYYYLLTVSTITIIFVCAVVALYYVHLLLPIVVMIGSFIMFVLWITGLVKASIELWGPLGSINDNCVRYVYNDDFWGGGNLYTLARIQQEGVCNLWQTTFALEMIAT